MGFMSKTFSTSVMRWVGKSQCSFVWDASEVIEFQKSANMARSEIGGAGDIFPTED